MEYNTNIINCNLQCRGRCLQRPVYNIHALGVGRKIMAENKRDYYEVLGVDKNVSDEDLQEVSKTFSTAPA